MEIPPADCQTMEQLRAAIDRLDTRLLDLFAERQAYVECAAVVKLGFDIPLRVPERIEFILDRVRGMCVERNLDPDLFAGFWEQVIEKAIEREATIQKEITKKKARAI